MGGMDGLEEKIKLMQLNLEKKEKFIQFEYEKRSQLEKDLFEAN